MKSQLKKIVKIFWNYDIINDMRIYQLKYTPITIKISLCKKVIEQYNHLEVNPKKIVFNNYKGKGYGDNCKYVAEELLLIEDGFELVWLVNGIDKYREEFPAGIRVVEYKSEDAIYEYCTAGIWISNYHLIEFLNRGLIKKEEQTYIQLWHGSLGIKKIEKDCASLVESKSWNYLAKKNSELTDYWISNSIFETEVYKRAFWSVENVLEIGHPRNDILFRRGSELIYKKVREYLNVSEEDKLVLYAPTFREGKDKIIQILNVTELIETLQTRFGGEWILVIRSHPRISVQAASLYENMDNEHIRIADDYSDMQELLMCVDVAITDYSSWIFDYMLTQKPGFIYAPDLKEYDSQRGFYYRIEDTPFPVAYNHHQLVDNIKEMNMKLYRKRINDFLVEKGCIEDGQASERLVSLIQAVLRGRK